MPTKLKKCDFCGDYSLREVCKNSKCKNQNKETKSAHNKFIKIKNAPKDSAKHFSKIRSKEKRKEK